MGLVFAWKAEAAGPPPTVVIALAGLMIYLGCPGGFACAKLQLANPGNDQSNGNPHQPTVTPPPPDHPPLVTIDTKYQACSPDYGAPRGSGI